MFGYYLGERSGTITYWIKGFRCTFGVLPNGSKTGQRMLVVVYLVYIRTIGQVRTFEWSPSVHSVSGVVLGFVF
jgi:hypothetical protein